MTNVKIEELPKNTLKLTFTIPHEDLQPFLMAAAETLSQKANIPGFRPGKAPFEMVKQHLGEMKIYEAALETIVRKTYIDALEEHKLETVGSPKIDLEKMAPDNDLVYTAEVSRMPKVLRLADVKDIKIDINKKGITEDDVTRVLKELQRMQTKETRATEEKTANETDKVVVAVDMKKEGVPVEGGQSPNHAIFLNEDYYIPGFKDHLIGMKEGEEKVFTLPFPKEHSNTFLAGHDIEFYVTLKELYNQEMPDLDDSFAEKLGQKDLITLKDLLKTNLENEKKQEQLMEEEKTILEAIVEKSRFEDLPDLLVNEEINKMLQELKQRVESQGADFKGYLESLKKSLSDLRLDFTPQAIIRIKVALAMQEIAKEQGIEAEEKEIDAELDKMAEAYEDKEVKNQIYSPAYRQYMTATIRNRKVIDYLRKIILK